MATDLATGKRTKGIITYQGALVLVDEIVYEWLTDLDANLPIADIPNRIVDTLIIQIVDALHGEGWIGKTDQ